MATWHEITRDPEYQELSEQGKALVKQGFFEREISSDPEFKAFSPQTQKAVFDDFWQTPDDSGQGIVTSTLGSAARGFGEIVPGTLEGIGALTGITPISDLGESAREGLEYIAPVNPIYEQGIPAKVANVAGNVASIIGTSGVGGLAGKALGAERAAAAGSAAARQALTNQAIQAGAKSALYGTGFAQGAAAKAAENERLGITGAEGYLNLLGGGISELAPEMLPFGSALETSAARRLLGGVDDAAGNVIPGIRMSAAQEAAEGGSTQVLSNLSTQLTAPTGVEAPGLFEGAGEAALWEGVGGAMFGAINKLGRTPPERQTAKQKAYAAKLGAIPVNSKPPITPEESLENFNQGGIPVVSPDGVVTTLPFNREDIRATNLPFNRDDIRATYLPFSREDIRPTQLPFNREDIRATELPFSRQNIRGLSQLGQPVPSPSQVIADTLLTNAVNVSSDATKATEAALAVVQGVAATAPVGLPVPTVAPTVETPSVKDLVDAGMPQDEAAAERQAQLEATAPKRPLTDLTDEELEQRIQDSSRLANETAVEGSPDAAFFTNAAEKYRAEKARRVAATTQAATPTPTAETLGVTAPPAPTLETPEGAARNADMLRQAQARLAGTEQGPRIGFLQPSEVAPATEAPPITPTQETPTPATEGTVMPGGSAMERDATKPVTQEQVQGRIQELLRAPTASTKKPAVSFKTKTEESAFARGFQAATEKQGELPPARMQNRSPKDQKWDDAWYKGWASGQTFVRSLPSIPSTGQLPQTTTVATPTETAAPLAKEAAVASVVQQPAEGSIPAVEQESATTAIESNEKADIADAAMAFLEEDLTESKRQWSPEKIAAAKAYFASGGKDMDVLRAAFPKLVGSRPIVQAYLKADKEASEAKAKRDAADAKLAKEIERDEKEQAKAEEAQRKRDELRLKTLNSLIQKTRTNVVQGTVKPTDANQAVAILNRSGEIPNVLFTWIGTSKDFLADPANRVRYPETWAAVSANSKIEGMSENGQPIVFTDNVGVSDLDRKLANLQGTTPEVAAVRRVILHENIHKGIFFLSMKEKMQIFSFLRRMYSPQELDSLAESYSEYSDWRTNQVSYFSILEEAMTRDFDSMVEIPRDGILAEFIQFLRGIWQKITGKTSEPTLKDYKDVFRLIRNSLKNSEKANADMLVNGGGVRMSMSEFLSNVTPEQDAEYMAAVEAGDVAKQQALVDEAAKAAGYNIGPVYHGTSDYGFTVFDASKLGGKTGAASAKKAFFFTSRRDVADSYTYLGEGDSFAGLQSSFDDLSRQMDQLMVESIGRDLNDLDDLSAQYNNLSKERDDVAKKLHLARMARGSVIDAGGVPEKAPGAGVYSVFLKIDSPLEIDFRGAAQRPKTFADLIEKAKTLGRDSVIIRNTQDNATIDAAGIVSDIFAILADSGDRRVQLPQGGAAGIVGSAQISSGASRIKSADPVTRDEQGNVIPLSRRFQSASNDIRFSKVEYDSPNDAAFNSGAEVARNTDYDERDKEVRSTIRAAYDIAPKTNGPSVPLDELFSIVQQSMPDLTETEFSRILQGLYEDSGALLIEGESPFATFTTEGERAGSAIIMPPTDMTKDDVISMLRGMSAANPAPSGEINQELYDTVLTRLRNFISNGGRIPLPIQLDRSGEANMDNYTGKKAGLGGGLRQGSGVGRAGQTDSGTPLFDGLPEGVQGVIPQAQRVESEVFRNREAIAGRGENREGKAGARPDMGMASGGYTFADYAQIASRIGARVQEVSNDIGGGLAVMADGNGATTILINATQLGKRVAGTSFGLDEDGAIETIGNALVEELIHAADLAVQREAWIASGRRKPFTEFAIDSDKSMLDEMREVVASSNDPVKATQILFDAIQASRQLYESGAAPSDIDKFFASEPRAISSVMSEFVRQMIQQDMHQTVSEASLFRRFIERVMKMLQKIRDAIAPAKAGEFGDILKNRINETEMMLAMAYQQTGARASMIDPEDAATKQFAKNIKDINSGTAKAPFGGVQFTNFMPIDRAVKSAEEYSDAAIKYVNNLEKEGVSLDDIANSVISPAFLESIGIEQDLMAQDALTIEVRQRVDNAAREEKSPGRKKQLSKLSERLSAFWQGVGSKKGQHLGQRRYLVNKARYSWMFIRDLAEKAMKEARTNILISNFGSENATSFTQNSYADSDKANQQAVDENINAAENDAEWSLIQEGVQILEGEAKSIWQRMAQLLRRFAFYARRKTMKAANAKASMTDAERNELNAILQMSDEEAATAEAKDLAEFIALGKRFLGEESAADTPEKKTVRKKREKMVEVAKKRADKGLTIESLESDSALSKMLREINRARPGEQAPLSKQIPWRQLLSQSAKTVEEYRQRIFDAISANEELKNATPEQKARLADLFAEAWESNRTRILDGMLERMIRAEEAKKNLSKEGAKALQAQRMRIVEDINLGIFDNDELAKRMAEKFGIKSEFTETEREKINSLIEVLQDEGLNAVKRQVAAYKLLEVLQGELKIPVAKMLADFWVSSVLSGPNTIVSIGLAVASGAFELSTALSRVFIAGFTNPKQLPSELAGAYKTLARLLSAYGRQARIAWQYLVSGDPVFLDPSMNDVTENMQWGNIGKSNKLAEQMAKSDKILVKSAGLFMRTVSRLLTALDVFNSGLTKEGSLSIVFRQIGLDPAKIAEMEKKSDLKPYKDAIIQKDFGGTPPKSARDKAILDSYALADMMAELDKLGNVSENANFFGQQGAMTLDPSGLGGVGYRAIRSLVTNAEAGADRFLKQAQRGWNDSAQNGDRILSGLELAFAYFMQFAAYNAANFGGVRFARFAGNKFNQGLSFIPGIGFARAFEAEFDPNRISGKEAFIDSIRRNQLIGVMLSVAGYQILKAIADEPDDEKRGWFINGGWGNLTPEKKQQKLAAGEKEYTIGINGKVFNYANWPISSALAAIGSLSDLIRFSPDQWNDKNVAQIMASAAMSGAAAAADIPALSQFQELFGNSLSSKDPNEKRMERFAKVMSSYAGGFVPRFLKDIDYAQDPNLRKYETLWEKTASHIPVYRRYEGKEYYDILGQQIQRNVYPGSREFMVKPTDPAYKVLGALNSRGIWLTPANAEHRMVGKGARRRSLTQEEADNYSLETGKGYKQMLLRYGQRALQMPTERARAFLLDKADEVRDRALKKVYRGYQPAT